MGTVMFKGTKESISFFLQKISVEAEGLQIDEPALKETRVKLSAQLLGILSILTSHFPQKKHINILSLGCGVPDEFLALKVHFNQHNITVNFVGIEISDEIVRANKISFKKFEESLILLRGDITNPSQLEKIMKYNGCLPEAGFDLIILRQPNIINMNRVFAAALMFTIPYFATTNARVFISTFHRDELDAVDKITRLIGRYSKPGSGNFCEMKPLIGVNATEGICFPDVFNMVLACKGNGIALRSSLTLPNAGSGRVLGELVLRFFKDVPIPLNIREIDHEVDINRFKFRK